MVLRITVTFSSAILGNNDSLTWVSSLVQVVCPALAKSLMLAGFVVIFLWPIPHLSFSIYLSILAKWASSTGWPLPSLGSYNLIRKSIWFLLDQRASDCPSVCPPKPSPSLVCSRGTISYLLNVWKNKWTNAIFQASSTVIILFHLLKDSQKWRKYSLVDQKLRFWSQIASYLCYVLATWSSVSSSIEWE